MTARCRTSSASLKDVKVLRSPVPLSSTVVLNRKRNDDHNDHQPWSNAVDEQSRTDDPDRDEHGLLNVIWEGLVVPHTYTSCGSGSGGVGRPPTYSSVAETSPHNGASPKSTVAVMITVPS